jgi:peptide/nickel transport system substrate-binding protein
MKKMLLIVLLLTFFIPAPSSFAAQDTMTVATYADLRSLDPLPSTENVTANVLLQLFETLVYIAPDGTLQPMLAESWEQPAPQSYLFHIKKGVKFHNGDECTAEDVKFTLDRAKSPLGATAQVFTKNIENVEVVDRYTVKINLIKPVTPFLFALGESWAGIVSKKAIENGNPVTSPVGTGPFRFVSWKKADRIVLERFEDYHGKKPTFKTLVIRPVTEASSRTIDLQSGAVDVAANIHFSDFSRIEGDPKLKLRRAPTNRVEYIVLNCAKPALKDTRVRKAIKLALDIPAMQQAVFHGAGFVTGSPLPPGMQYSLKDRAPLPVQDIEGAKKLLEEAGIKNLKLDLVSFEHKERMDAATIIQSMLEEVGIQVDIKIVEMGAFYEIVSKGEFDICLTGWGNNLPDAEYFFGRTLHSSAIGGLNYSRYNNPELDALLEKGLTVPEGAERAQIYTEAQKILLDDVPIIFWSVAEIIVGTSAKIENFEMDPRNMFRFWMANFTD